MQSASVNYAHASSGAGGVWASPRLQVDWMRDGYDVTPNMVDQYRRNLSAQWGSTDTGQQWVNLSSPASAFSVVYDGTDNLTGAYGQHSIGVPGVFYHTRESVLTAPLVFVATQTLWLSLPVLPLGDSIECMMLFRRVDASNYYRAGVVISTSGAIDLVAVRVTDNTDHSLISASSGVTYAGGSQVLAVRGQLLADGTIRLKAWIEGTPVPAAWQAQAADADQNGAAGAPGIRTVVYPNNTNVRPVLIKYHRYQVDNSLPDDISGQLGSWSVEHHIDDGYPDSVTFIAGIGVANMTADLGPPPAYLTNDIPMQVAEYYSPYSTESPIYGRDRDVAPVRLDHGVVTDDGIEQVTVFTGQMLDIPVKRGKATLSATSANRLKMAKSVQPQAFWRFGPGLNGSWPVSWAMAECGVYVSPPPREGVAYWNPMHGSTRPFIPNANLDSIFSDDGFASIPSYFAFRILADGSFNQPDSFGWVTGPYLLAGDLQLLTAESRRHAITYIRFDEDAAGVLTSSENKARCEFWVRGDATNVNTAPGGSGTVTRLCGFQFSANAGARFASFGVNTSRQVEVKVIDGAGHTATLVSDDTLPTDGNWYFVGAAYDVAGKKLWVTNFAGTTKSAAASTLVTSSLPTVDIWTSPFPNFVSYLPCAEVHITTGAQANVDTYPTWLNGIAFTPTARISPSNLELVAMIEKEPVEAWEFVAGFAQAELASMRTDELDVVCYLTPGWWVKDGQQVVTDLVSTETNAEALDINIDPTKVRNSVQVSFDRVEISFGMTTAYSLSQQLTIPPGTTTIRFPLTNPIVSPRSSNDPETTDDNGAIGYDQVPFDYVTLNSEPDGTGTYATTEVIITRIAWDAGSETWRFQNNSSITWYTANATNKPTLRIAGTVATVIQDFATDADATSVATRGERFLSVTASATQSAYDARRLAGLLKMGLREGRPLVEGLTLFGEARRQPGDLVQFEDPSVTRASGLWRFQSIIHNYKVSGDVAYTQDVIVRPVLPICVVGEGIIGASLVGPRE